MRYKSVKACLVTESLRKFINIAENRMDKDTRVLWEQQRVLNVIQRFGA